MGCLIFYFYMFLIKSTRIFIDVTCSKKNNTLLALERPSLSRRLHTHVALKRLLFIFLLRVCSQISSHRTADVPTATYSKGTAIKHNVSNASRIQGDADPTTLTTKQRENKQPRDAPDTAKKTRRNTEKYKEPGNLNLHHLNLHPNRTQITLGTPPNYPPV